MKRSAIVEAALATQGLRIEMIRVFRARHIEVYPRHLLLVPCTRLPHKIRQSNMMLDLEK